MDYRPPFQVTARAINMLANIERLLGQVDLSTLVKQEPMLRRQNRVRSVKDSLAIEGNSISLEQATAIFNNKRVAGPKNEILEIQNAIKAYADADQWQPQSEQDFKKAHGLLMAGLLASAGKYRAGAVGILKGTKVSHVAPSAKQLPQLMHKLFHFAARTKENHPMIIAAVVHYEIEFIHPFEDGNGRIGRLWQHLVLRKYHRFFEHVPFESFIFARQKQYYRILEECDRTGDSTAFIDFSLEALYAALKEQVLILPHRHATVLERLEAAKAALGKNWFSRKEYIQLFSEISLPTASRDLARALGEKMLRSKGENNQTRYKFL